MTIEEHVPLAPLTTFGIGGEARYFARASDEEGLAAALSFARGKSLWVFFLGGGSNVLVPDEGFEGLVIKIDIRGIVREGNSYIAGAGEDWDALVIRAAQDGLWGIENLSGIPGSVGGACVQNIGAYGAALSESLESVDALDTRDGSVRSFSRGELSLGYRESLFKKEPGRYVVLRARLSLSQNPAPKLSYRDVAGRFSDRVPELSDIRQAILDIRTGKFPDLSQEGSAGSYFKNPILSDKRAGELEARFPGLPLFDMPETSGKKAALGWILDHVLALKGLSQGGARVFEKQALVIAAARVTRAADVKMLAGKIKSLVRERIGIEIEEEVCVL